MEKNKLLSLMRYWLIGTFLVVLAATTTYVGLFSERNWLKALEISFPIWGITALLCVAWYLIYQRYIERK